MVEPIENHAVIGDLNTVALGGAERGDRFSLFSQVRFAIDLCGAARSGKGRLTFKSRPELNGAKHKQLYLPDSNILLTRFLSGDGVAEISDFMADGGSGGRAESGAEGQSCPRRDSLSHGVRAAV